MKVILIGAGNVGYHLGRALHKAGVNIIEVFSRVEEKAAKLAKKIDAKPQTSLNKLSDAADLYIIAVKDDAIFAVAEELSKSNIKNKLVVHTSGGTSTVELGKYLPHFGSFYPLQTFSLSKKPDWQTIPICVDANAAKSKKILLKLARKISPKVYEINDQQRAILHVAAVFVNNFSNHLFHIASTICEEENLSFDILQPLIVETVNKLQVGKPSEMQTGPALRNDQKTIANHLNYLEKHPTFKKMYEDLTPSIQNKII